MNLDDLKTLIDKASKVCGSDYKLAKTVGVSRTLVSDWRHGRKRCAPEDVAILAGVAGLPAEEWAMRAMLWKWEGTPKGERLLHALGKCFLATGAAIASSGVSATTADSVANLIRCIESKTKNGLFGYFLGPERRKENLFFKHERRAGECWPSASRS